MPVVLAPFTGEVARVARRRGDFLLKRTDIRKHRYPPSGSFPRERAMGYAQSQAAGPIFSLGKLRLRCGIKAD